MTYLVVDASLWVARFVPQDAYYKPVKDWLTAKRNEDIGFVSPSLLLAEVGGAISRRTRQPALALRAIERLQHLPGVQLVDMDFALAQEAALLAAQLGLRGADSFYVAVAARLDLPIVTLDEDQKEKAAKRVTVVELP